MGKLHCQLDCGKWSPWKHTYWVCLRGCFQKGLTEDRMSTLNVGSTISWPGVPNRIKGESELNLNASLSFLHPDTV